MQKQKHKSELCNYDNIYNKNAKANLQTFKAELRSS